MRRFIFFIFIVFVGNVVSGQSDLEQNEDSVFLLYSNKTQKGYHQDRPYYVATLDNNSLTKNLRIIRQINERIGIIELPDQLSFDESNLPRLEPANDKWKLSPTAIERGNSNKLIEKIILSAISVESLLKVLKDQAKEVEVILVDEPSQTIVVKTKSRVTNNWLLGLKQVIFFDVVLAAKAEVGIIGYDRSFHGINAVDYLIPGANGKNIVSGVKEQKMQEADLDLWKRVLNSPLAAPTITNHATVIASIIGGAGNSFYDGRGIAWGTLFFPSSFSNLFPDDLTILNSNKVSVQNHSYGTVIQQFYGAEALSYDAQTWSNKNIMHVFSSGNQGTGFAIEGKYANIPGYANLTANFKMAKNVVTVGAIDNKGNIPAESSAGPLYDGRMGPQLTALGPNGTSDAAAVVTGTVAVLQQVYADSNSQALPAASLVKSILYNTADDIHSPGIDYKTGFGLLDSYGSVRALQQKKYDGSSLAQGQSWTKNINVPSNAAQIKVTLSWTDTSAAVNNNKALINDLDLELTELSNGLAIKPWVLSQAANKDSLAKLPTRRRDSLNTAEQISFKSPPAGVYQIKVSALTVPGTSIPFHVAYNIDTINSFFFTSPQHASDVNRKENPVLTLRWKTFVNDTNQTGNLYISYDRGLNWQLIASAYKIYTNQYQWPIKDTASTGVFKMETSFGSFTSKEIIISPVIRPLVDFLCTDSFRLSWNKHIYASQYRIWTLVDSPYLKNILNVNDTFVVLKRSVYPYNVYAVEPVLVNGLPAARSIALDIEYQGIHCFYKGLNYELLDFNQVKLVLELSVVSYVDSVFFEKVTATGQVLQNYGGAKVNNGTFIYNQLVNSMPAGLNFVRAKIKLNTGEILYTNIIQILTSGQSLIVFYPNPASRNLPLKLVPRQGIPVGATLRLFDIGGRLLKIYTSLSDPINLSSYAPGIIIYKVVDASGGYLGSGKILIQ